MLRKVCLAVILYRQRTISIICQNWPKDIEFEKVGTKSEREDSQLGQHNRLPLFPNPRVIVWRTFLPETHSFSEVYGYWRPHTGNHFFQRQRFSSRKQFDILMLMDLVIMHVKRTSTQASRVKNTNLPSKCSEKRIKMVYIFFLLPQNRFSRLFYLFQIRAALAIMNKRLMLLTIDFPVKNRTANSPHSISGILD